MNEKILHFNIIKIKKIEEFSFKNIETNLLIII